MAVYTHSTAERYTHGSTNRVQSVKGARATTFSRATSNLRTRKRVAANFKTAERIYGADFPKFGAPLGVSYDQTDITKTDRNPAAGK